METLKMDKDQYLTEEEMEQMFEDGFDFDDVVGKETSFTIMGMLDENNRWNLDAKVRYSMTRNGIDWVTNDFPISTADEDYDAALATTMLGVASMLGNPRMLARMRKKLDKQLIQPKEEVL